MTTGSDLVTLAKRHLGETYRLGALAPKNNANWRGPWDCAEFISWVAFQKEGRLFGCNSNNGNPASADAWTGFWKRDVDANTVTKITVPQARTTPGAILLRFPAPGMIGHIVFVDGPNRTVEAHSSATGVIQHVIDNRRWDCGVLLPNVQYGNASPGAAATTPTIYRLIDPHMTGSKVREIQSRLRALGFNPGPVDGDFGPMTAAAVKALQMAHGVVADGEVGSVTSALLGVTL